QTHALPFLRHCRPPPTDRLFPYTTLFRSAPGLPYARGRILPSTEDDFRKLQEAWRHIAARVRSGGPEAMFNFSGLEHGLPLSPDELPMANDFVAPALYFDQFKQAALEHFGGSRSEER